MPGDTDVLTAANPSAHSAQLRGGGRGEQRDQSLDIAKGFGIFLVVAGHVLDGLIAANFFPGTAQWPALTVYVIYLFHMPLFFVISGHLASGRHRPASVTIKKLIPTIVYPYFLWSILEGLTLVYLSRYTNSHASISILYKIFWIPIVPYWFLYALFLCQVGYLAIRGLSHRVQIILAIALFFLPAFFQGPIAHTQLLIILESTRGFLYFILGVVSVGMVKQFGRWTGITASVLFVLFATIFYQSQLDGLLAAVAVLPAAFAGIIATLAWSRVLASRGGWLTGMMALWGRYSMSIYVMHIFFTAATRIVLNRLGLQAWVHAVPRGRTVAIASLAEIGIATAAGILLPLGFNRIVSQFNLDRWFGLQHMEIDRERPAESAA